MFNKYVDFFVFVCLFFVVGGGFVFWFFFPALVWLRLGLRAQTLPPAKTSLSCTLIGVSVFISVVHWTVAVSLKL